MPELEVINTTNPRPRSPSVHQIPETPLIPHFDGSLERDVEQVQDLHIVGTTTLPSTDFTSTSESIHVNLPEEFRGGQNVDTTAVPESHWTGLKGYIVDRMQRKRTSWLSVGLGLELLSFAIAISLNIASMVIFASFPLNEWLANDPKLTTDEQTDRVDTILALRSIYIFHVMGLWETIFQLGIYLDLMWNQDPILTIFFMCLQLGRACMAIAHYFTEKNMFEIIASDENFPGNTDAAFQNAVTASMNMALAKPILACVILLIWIPMLVKIYRTLRWSHFRKFGGSKVISRRIASHNFYKVCLKLFVLVAVNVAIIWAVFILSPPSLDDLPPTSVVNLVLALLVTFAVALLGYLASRLQSLLLMIIYILVLVAGSILLPIGLTRSRYYYEKMGLESFQSAWSFPVWVALCVICLILQIIAACMACYYIWLGPWLQWSVLAATTPADVPGTVHFKKLTTKQRLWGSWSGFVWEYSDKPAEDGKDMINLRQGQLHEQRWAIENTDASYKTIPLE